MNTFFDYVQPTIIQASMVEELPEHIRGRFFVNFNVFGIPYFTDNFILGESTFGAPYLLLKEDSWGFELEDALDAEVLDIPRIYIDITDEFVNDKDNLFTSFIYQAIMDNKIWAVGIDNFLAGKQYYLNHTLYNYLANTNQIEVPNFEARLPNYLDTNIEITKYWRDLTGEIYHDYKNISYFNEKNKLLGNVWDEDSLNNFYSTFCRTILEQTRISDETRAMGMNPIYDLVLRYYAGFQSDCASNAISLILNSMYGTSTVGASCGCNTTISNSDAGTVQTQTCFQMYQEAMYLYLKQMLGDTQFYRDWFGIDINADESIPNEVLIEALRTLIEEFMKLGHTLSFLPQRYKKGITCPVVTYDDSDCNYGTMSNYLKVLGWVQEQDIDANVNKIKIYGSQFGALLPSLQF